MSEFEFVLTGTTIVLALAIARLLEGLRDSLNPGRRYWIHSLWVVIKLMNTIGFFWGALPYREAELNFASFLIMVGVAGIFFLQAHALVTADPAKVSDWQSLFWSIRRWFFAANGAAILLILALPLMTQGGAGQVPTGEPAVLAVLLALSGAGFASSNERLHGVIATAAAAINLGGLTLLFVRSLANAA